MEYFIVKCPYCGNLLACPSRLRTKSCPYCGKRFKVYSAVRVARAKDAQEASTLVRLLKAKEYGLLEALYGRGKESYRLERYRRGRR